MVQQIPGYPPDPRFGDHDHMNIKLAQCVFFPCLPYHKLYIIVFSQFHDAPTQGIEPSTIRWITLRLNFSYLQAHTSNHRPIMSSTYDVHHVLRSMPDAATTIAPKDGSNPTFNTDGDRTHDYWPDGHTPNQLRYASVYVQHTWLQVRRRLGWTWQG